MPQETGPCPPPSLGAENPTTRVWTSRTRSTAPQPHLAAPWVRLARPGTAWRTAVRAHRASAAR
eukprot:7033684-Prymnesium_polylepis.1